MVSVGTIVDSVCIESQEILVEMSARERAFARYFASLLCAWLAYFSEHQNKIDAGKASC